MSLSPQINFCLYFIGGCCCGKRFPTPSKMMNSQGQMVSSCMGFDPEKGKYGIKGKCCAYGFLLCFVGVTGAMIAAGNVGSVGLTKAMQVFSFHFTQVVITSLHPFVLTFYGSLTLFPS
jgi:hypothetical protein